MEKNSINDEIDVKIKDLWEDASKLGISKLGSIKIHDGGYFSISKPSSADNLKLYGRFDDFKFNINRVIHLYEDIVKIKPDNKEYNLKYQLFCEIVVILLMTSLEAYLRDRFIAIISNIKQFKSDKKINKSMEEIYSKVEKNEPIFQIKTYTKLAYSLIGINLIDIVDKEAWRRIYSKNRLNSKSKFPGYMKLRHLFVHKGAHDSLYNYMLLDEKCVRMAIIDALKIVYTIQLKIPDYSRSTMIDAIELFKHGKIKFRD